MKNKINRTLGNIYSQYFLLHYKNLSWLFYNNDITTPIIITIQSTLRQYKTYDIEYRKKYRDIISLIYLKEDTFFLLNIRQSISKIFAAFIDTERKYESNERQRERESSKKKKDRRIFIRVAPCLYETSIILAIDRPTGCSLISLLDYVVPLVALHRMHQSPFSSPPSTHPVLP